MTSISLRPCRFFAVIKSPRCFSSTSHLSWMCPLRPADLFFFWGGGGGSVSVCRWVHTLVASSAETWFAYKIIAWLVVHVVAVVPLIAVCRLRCSSQICLEVFLNNSCAAARVSPCLFFLLVLFFFLSLALLLLASYFLEASPFFVNCSSIAFPCFRLFSSPAFPCWGEGGEGVFFFSLVSIRCTFFMANLVFSFTK